MSDDKLLDRNDLDLYVKQSIEEMPDETDVDSEVKIFRNALDFSTLKVKDCMVPRQKLLLLAGITDIHALKEKFIETSDCRAFWYMKIILMTSLVIFIFGKCLVILRLDKKYSFCFFCS